MKNVDKFSGKELIDLLGRCWMTHDGMWFYSCFQEYGIEMANKLNKAAIKTLAPLEIMWMKKAFGVENEKISNFDEFKEFFMRARQVFIPDFMNVTATIPRENVLRWDFKPKNCFAYKGISRIGVIEKYECGVIYRLCCWFDTLGISYRVSPMPTRCAMIDNENCSGEFVFTFDQY